MQCKAKRRDGKPCGTTAQHGKLTCWQHDYIRPARSLEEALHQAFELARHDPAAFREECANYNAAIQGMCEELRLQIEELSEMYTAP